MSHSESLCSGATVVAGQGDGEVAGDVHGGSTLVEALLSGDVSGETTAPRWKVLLLLFNFVLGLGIVTPNVCIYH